MNRSTEVRQRVLELGLEIEASQASKSVLLDSFDGLLAAADLRLEWTDADGGIVRCTGPAFGTAVAPCPTLPTSAESLPQGVLRQRLAKVLGVRVLLPVLTLRGVTSTCPRRNQLGKSVVKVTLTEIECLDDGSRPVPFTVALEVETLSGHDGPAERLIGQLTQAGLHRHDDSMLATVAIACGIPLSGFRGKPSVPLDPRMPALEGYQAVLANLARTIVANWDGTIAQTDSEFLHELRVAVRRSRTILGEGKRVIPQPHSQWARDHLGLLGRVTGPARDLDVLLIEWDGYLDGFDHKLRADVAPIRTMIEAKCHAAHRDLAAVLESAEVANAMGSWTGWLRTPAATIADPERDTHEPLGPVVAKRLERAQRTLLGAARRIGPESPAEQVHELRKDAKRLRYILECFGGLLPPEETKRFVRTLKGFQDYLGFHQDAAVHAEEFRSLADELTDAPVETIVGVGELLGVLDQTRVSARLRFAEEFARYDTESTERAFTAIVRGIGS